jgi:hypothetical protein
MHSCRYHDVDRRGCARGCWANCARTACTIGGWRTNVVLIRALGRDTPLPGRGCSVLVENCDDDCVLVVGEQKVDRIQKPMKQRTSGASYIGKLTRHLAHPTERASKCVDKLIRECVVMLRIPSMGVQNIRFGSGTDDQTDHCRRFRRSASTSSHGRPSFGLARWSASRSSRTSRCQSGTGTWASLAAMRSQRACT